MSAQEEYQKGISIHNNCYPFGLQGVFLDAAKCFRNAWEESEVDGLSEVFVFQCRFSYYDALADHEYYNTENYEQAAYYYGLAIDMVERVLDLSDEVSGALWRSSLRYLQAIREESLGLHLEAQGDWVDAIRQLRRAMHIYQVCRQELPSSKETEHEHQLLLHSITGLLGQVCYERGMLHSENRNWSLSRRCFRRALDFYDQALTYHPAWALSSLSDNYHRWVDMVRQRIASLPNGESG